MLLEATTDNLYDPIVALYEGLFGGERSITLRLSVRENADLFLLQDFLSLAEDGQRDFGASIELEVIDDARLLQ